MYRYLLFSYYDCYPSGGMNDCIFKTNNFDELILFINNNCDIHIFVNIYCYDIVENKIIYADIEMSEDESGICKYMVVGWSDDDG